MSQRTALLILILLFGLGVQPPEAVLAQQKVGTKSAQPSPNDEKKAAEIETFISYAQSVAPEFSADLLIHVVESGQIKESKRKQELLVEAFYQAAKAKEQVPLIGIPGGNSDTRAGYRVIAMRDGLDGLSLQCRAIKALLQLNKKKARRLFDEIKIKSESLTCSDALTKDTSVFFTTLLVVAQTAFSVEEMQRSEHESFVEENFSKLNSPDEIETAVRILISLSTTDLELMGLVRSLNAALKRIPSDYRSFSGGRTFTGNSIHELVLMLNRRNLSADELLEAYRTFLVNQLSGSRCDEANLTAGRQKLATTFVNTFNNTLRTAAYKKVAPITDDEIKPGRVEGRVQTQDFWVSPKAEKLLQGIRQLRFGPKGKNVTADEKESSEWQSQLSEFVRELADWGPADEKSEEDYFHQKSVIYYALIPAIPPDSQYDGVRDEALRDFTTMLDNSPLQKDKPAEWYSHAKPLFERVDKAQPQEREKLLSLIYSSRSTVLHLYAQQQQLFQATK